jgi:hypothetical protein
MMNLGLPGFVFSPDAPIHAGIEALEQFNRDTRPLCPTEAGGRGNGGRDRPVAVVAAE